MGNCLLLDLFKEMIKQKIAEQDNMMHDGDSIIYKIEGFVRYQFLFADTQLYKRLCRSVGPSRRIVGPLVHRSIKTS